ncbi:MAG: hypothetical protein ACLGGX_10960 [Bdellovibrionia bacterium]
MKILFIIFYAILLSSNSFAQLKENFVKVAPDFNVKKNEIELNPKFIPPIKSQDSLGICFGMCGAAVANYYLCKTTDTDCSKLGTNSVSPLAAAGYSTTNSVYDRAGVASSHTNIRFGGSCVSVLENMGKAGFMAKDSCFDFDTLANKYGNDAAAIESVLKNLEAMFNKKTEADFCYDCLKNELNEKLGTNLNTDDIKAAVDRNHTFDTFLYRATIAKKSCDRGHYHKIDIESRPTVGVLNEIARNPDGKLALQPIKVTAIVDKIKEVLSKDFPLAISNICPISDGNKCKESHAVMITGYRKQCKPNGKDCREVIRIHNSWGKAWQDQFDGGWVDVKSLFEGKDSYPAELGWWLPPQ